MGIFNMGDHPVGGPTMDGTKKIRELESRILELENQFKCWDRELKRRTTTYYRDDYHAALYEVSHSMLVAKILAHLVLEMVHQEESVTLE